MHVRIAPDGLVIDLNSGSGSLALETSIEVWPYWFDIAMDQVVQAHLARTDLVMAHSIHDEEQKARALHQECKSAMIAISACAFGIDAIYGAVTERASVARTTLDQWSINRTPRYSRIHQTFVQLFRMSNTHSKDMRLVLRQIFELRDRSVHASGAFSPPCLHPVLNVGIERRLVDNRVANAHASIDFSLALVKLLSESPRAKFGPLVAWARGPKR
jgi:hypothetical protein